MHAFYAAHIKIQAHTAPGEPKKSRVFIFDTSVKYRASMNKLNPRQQKATKLIDRHLLVLAGAGSGKTSVITEKIAYLLQQHKVDPARIAAVTFTNKAAEEMRNRISARVGKKLVTPLSVSTFHTLGLKILRRECKTLGYKPGFSIFDATDVQTLLQEILREHNSSNTLDPASAAWQISQLKNALQTPADALKQAADGQQATIAGLYQRYQQQLKAYNAVDFDDLIVLPMQLLKSTDSCGEKWQKKLDYLLVDEYQDTGPSQYEFVRALMGKQTRLTAVGDDDQSIYAWRGAQPENLQKLTEDFSDLDVIKLEQNYRSMGRILKCANQLIANNPHHFEKKLWSELGYGDPVRIIPCATPEDEAEQLALEVLHTKFQTACRLSDFAILYRGNHQSRLFESALRLHDLPYKVSGGTAFFDRAEIKDLLAYLRLIVNPDDDAALLRIINTPRREIGANTLEKLGAFAGDNNCALFEALNNPALGQSLSSAAVNRLSHFTDLINELKFASHSLDAPQLLHKLIDEIAYLDWLANTTKDKAVTDSRIKNVTELCDWIKKLSDRQDQPLTLDELLGKLTLMDIIGRKEDERDAIQLMTLHAAKGLEFKHVFIAGFEEGLIPHHSAETDAAVYEERRLAYVGITRAKRNLTISFSKKRKRQGTISTCEPSRFLQELPMDDIQWENADNIPESEKRAKGNASLDSLRKILA